jgi:hypothetical protein
MSVGNVRLVSALSSHFFSTSGSDYPEFPPQVVKMRPVQLLTCFAAAAVTVPLTNDAPLPDLNKGLVDVIAKKVPEVKKTLLDSFSKLWEDLASIQGLAEKVTEVPGNAGKPAQVAGPGSVPVPQDAPVFAKRFTNTTKTIGKGTATAGKNLLVLTRDWRLWGLTYPISLDFDQFDPPARHLVSFKPWPVVVCRATTDSGRAAMSRNLPRSLA